MSCKRKFGELKTSDEEKALLKKIRSKINWICHKVVFL